MLFFHRLTVVCFTSCHVRVRYKITGIFPFDRLCRVCYVGTNFSVVRDILSILMTYSIDEKTLYEIIGTKTQSIRDQVTTVINYQNSMTPLNSCSIERSYFHTVPHTIYILTGFPPKKDSSRILNDKLRRKS